MATEIKNKWVFMFSYEVKILIITELLKFLARFTGGYWDLFTRSYHVNTVNLGDPVFRESSNLMSVSRLIATVVIGVPIAFDFGDA